MGDVTRSSAVLLLLAASFKVGVKWKHAIM